jgi:acyl-coenzyme A thioesterase 9
MNSISSSLLTADFTFVARDAKSNLKVKVPQLLVQSEVQQCEWRVIQERVALRKSQSTAAALNNASVSANAAELIEKGRLLTELPGPSRSDAVLSVATALENTFVTQPQTRNMSGRVFGGFLMKRAFELAFSTAYMFSGFRLGQKCGLGVLCLLRTIWKCDVFDYLQARSTGNGRHIISSSGECG